jgi:AcrR family transcriptional regulator
VTSKPAKTKKPYHHGDLQTVLIDAAEALLREVPVELVTLREIARRAGVSHAAPKHHFQSLGDLMGEVAARGFERFVEALDRAIDLHVEPEARLLEMGRAYLRFAQDHPSTYGLMFGKKQSCNVTPHFVTAAHGAWLQLEKAVVDVIGPSRAQQGALMVWSASHGFSMLVLENRLPPHLDPATGIDQMMRMVIAGMKAQA